MKLYFLFILMFFLSKTYCQSITTTGNWVASKSPTSISQAGNNHTSNLNSSLNETLVTLQSLTAGNWQVWVRKIDSDWDASLTLAARRTGTGSSSISPTIIGGDPAITLTSMLQSFFSISVSSSGNINDIPISYVVNGISVLLPAKTYSTTIEYTLMDY